SAAQDVCGEPPVVSAALILLLLAALQPSLDPPSALGGRLSGRSSEPCSDRTCQLEMTYFRRVVSEQQGRAGIGQWPLKEPAHQVAFVIEQLRQYLRTDRNQLRGRIRQPESSAALRCTRVDETNLFRPYEIFSGGFDISYA